MWYAAKKPTPSPSPTVDPGSGTTDNPVTQSVDIFNNIISWSIQHPIPVIALVTIIGAFYGWSQLRIYMLQRRGVNLPPLGDIIGRTLAYLIKEDTYPVITKPKGLAQRMVWFTGRRQTLFAVVLVTVLSVLGFTGWALIASVAFGYSIYSRTRKVFQYRMAVVSTMFQVANAEFKYGKGSEMNPRAYIRVSKWQDVYFPQATVVVVPSGYQSEDPRNRERFETNWTGSVTDQHGWTYEWESAKGRVTCSPTPKLPTSAPHPGIQPHDWNTFPMGVTYGEKEALWDVSVAPHILLCGPTGTGKSVQQRNILLHALSHPQWRIVGLDPKKVELAALRDPSSPTGLKPGVLRVATTLEDMTEALAQAEDEMNRRYLEMEKIGVNHFLNLPEPLPALLVMIDETFALLSMENIKSDEGKERDAMHARCATLIGSIARLGRASGVHLCLATQRPDAKVLSGELKNNLDARIACGRMDTTPSLMVLDSDAATRLPLIKGRGILRNGGEFMEYQGYFCSPDKFEGFIASGRDMYATMAAGPAPEADDNADGKKRKGKKKGKGAGYSFLPSEDRLFASAGAGAGLPAGGDLFGDSSPSPSRRGSASSGSGIFGGSAPAGDPFADSTDLFGDDDPFADFPSSPSPSGPSAASRESEPGHYVDYMDEDMGLAAPGMDPLPPIPEPPVRYPARRVTDDGSVSASAARRGATRPAGPPAPSASPTGAVAAPLSADDLWGDDDDWEISPSILARRNGDSLTASNPDTWETCNSCGGKINPVTFECRCSI